MSQYGLLGRKLGHSWSPAIHRELGTWPYGLYEVEPEKLADFLSCTELNAMNVTIPYKKAVIPFCATLSETAEKLGSVNTLVKRGNGWHGDNTDYYGFVFMVRQAGISPAGKKALVLGSGGAGLTVTQALKDMGAAVTVISRSGENNYGNLHLHADARIIVNTTPVGMYPNNGQAPVSLRQFPCCEGVLDLIYNPRRTALLLEAEALGIPCADGLAMLVAQAKRAAELFTDTCLDDSLIPQITKKLTGQMLNIVLIGMPGCGKTTVAEALGKALQRETLDADAEIVRIAGKSIPDIFREDGEEIFRQTETRVLGELGRRTGVILSTGGGCVTRRENLPLLRQNGILVWLQRNIRSLPTDGRPLSQSGDLAEMYRIRKPLYEEFADITVDNTGPVEQTVRAIKEAIL